MSGLEQLLLAEHLESSLVQRLTVYGGMLLESNRRWNLSGAKTPEALVPHILDSLTLLPFAAEALVDVGSGAGLPAIPLAIAGGLRITLVEATLRKARFLEGVLLRLGLRGEVVWERAEIAAHEERLRDRFASGTARAVAGATVVAELLLPFIAPGGVALLQRGAMSASEIDALADAALVLGGSLERVLPIADRRCIVLIRKTGATPARFPRRPGVPQRRPLCS